MAYATTAELPEDVRAALPADAQGIFLKAFNADWADNEDDASAAAAGWAAVKSAGFTKGSDGKWASEAQLNEDTDKLAQLVDLLSTATELAGSIMDDYAPQGPPGGQGAPPMAAGEAGSRDRARRGRRHGSARDAVSFDPADRASLEALAEAMLSDAKFAAEVHRVAEKLRGTEVEGEYVQLSEQAVRDDGTTLIKMIAPGWGSSGYYSSEMLERDGAKTFPKGTKMYWNHQTEAEEQARPEGDLRDLAATTLEDARWMAEGPKGAGLYAHASVFTPYRDLVEELAPHIGVSIRAFGKASEGTAEGRDGTLIDSLTYGQSVDFVTEPGAGGRVLELFESVRTKEEGMSEQEKQEITAAKEGERRALEALAVRDAKDVVAVELKESGLPEASQKRLSEKLSAAATISEDGSLDAETLKSAVAEAVKDEAAYLSDLGAGGVQGLGGSSSTEDPAEAKEALEKSLVSLGMSESAAKASIAAR